MARKLYLHIGTHKTGTTSIQFILNRNRDALLEHGILFPAAAQYHFSQHRLAFSLRGSRTLYGGEKLDPERELAAIMAEIEACQPRTIILSSEEFFDLGLASMTWLRERLADFDVSIIGCIRRQDDLFASMYNQRVKEHRNNFRSHYSEHLDTLEKFYPNASFGNHLDRWAAVFGREAMTVLCYEQVDDMVARFRALTDMDVPLERGAAPQTGAMNGQAVPIRVNASLSVEALEIVRHAKGLTQDTEKRARLFKAAHRHFPGRNMHRLMTQEERMRILERYKDENAHVFRTYLNSENLYDPARFADQPSEPRVELKLENVMSLLVDVI